MARLLLIEDNPDLARNVEEFLAEDGFEIRVAADGATGLRLAIPGDFDVIVLDLGLPRLDGLEVCRQVRAALEGGPPILMLTARDTLEEKLEGFEAGADDYLVKPFALKELAARVKALLRRPGARPVTEEATPSVLEVADLRYDVGQCRVERAGAPITLNRIGHRLLEMLMKASPNVVRRQEIDDEIWGRQIVSESVLRTHVWSLRRAVDGDRVDEEKLIHTVHGIGYRMGARDTDS